MAAGNYTLNGIVGFELSHKTYGVVGTGNIGIEVRSAAQLLVGSTQEAPRAPHPPHLHPAPRALLLPPALCGTPPRACPPLNILL